MNERIEQLKKLAMIRVNNPTVNSDGKVICDNWEEGISLSKFAELIVKECMSITDKCSTGSGIHDLFADEIIAEHFGVEE